jgi:hypothetical protein
MATDEWLSYGGVELVNLARTTALAVTLGIDTLWTDPEAVAWVEDARNGEDYDLISTAPWYDAGFPASAEFAGIVPLSIAGLDDSTKEATTTEYITNGGSSGKPRNKTLSLPCNVAIIASTERGADFGKRWLDRVLGGRGSRTFCSGSELAYYQWEPSDVTPLPPVVHRRDVTISKATTVTRKRSNYCSATWIVTFTLVANDPFEYGEPVDQFTGLGGAVTGGGVVSSGSVGLIETSCPVYDYSPIYDPLYPALVAPPTLPTFYPDGWDFADGAAFTRYWVRTAPVEPSALGLVPTLTLLSAGDVSRMVRIQVWPGNADVESMCDPLWTAYVTYLLPDVPLYIDGEQQASYFWDGVSAAVRRADSLVYGEGATPIGWDSFNDPNGLLITLDLQPSLVEGAVTAGLSLVPKSD